MSDFDAIKFLELLLEACMEQDHAGEKFTADPDMLGPRLLATLKKVEQQDMHLRALRDNAWIVVQHPNDGLWRVASPLTGIEVPGQSGGYEDRDEALNHAIIATKLGQ